MLISEEKAFKYPEKTRRHFLKLTISGHGGHTKYNADEMILAQKRKTKDFDKMDIVSFTQATYLIQHSLKQIKKYEKLLRKSLFIT